MTHSGNVGQFSVNVTQKSRSVFLECRIVNTKNRVPCFINILSFDLRNFYFMVTCVLPACMSVRM